MKLNNLIIIGFAFFVVIIALSQINLMAKESTENNKTELKTPQEVDSSWAALREIREKVGAPTGEVLTKPIPDEPEFQEDPLGVYSESVSKEKNVTSLQNNKGVE